MNCSEWKTSKEAFGISARDWRYIGLLASKTVGTAEVLPQQHMYVTYYFVKKKSLKIKLVKLLPRHLGGRLTGSHALQ